MKTTDKDRDQRTEERGGGSGWQQSERMYEVTDRTNTAELDGKNRRRERL